MSQVKDHYDNHLAHFYSWMLGDFESRANEHQDFFSKNEIQPHATGVAIDLGCGNGIQAIALARLGFSVTAVDFSPILLKELESHSQGLNIEIIETDILDFHLPKNIDIAICMGDTLTHLPDWESIEILIQRIARALAPSGKFILSFRDLNYPLTDTQRFLPVRSDETKILTCFLEDCIDHVRVSDLLQEYENGKWNLKVSSYQKLKLSAGSIKKCLIKNNLTIISEEVNRGMQIIIAQQMAI